jgi:hypothetical protein
MNMRLEQARRKKSYTVLLEYLGEYFEDGKVQTYLAHVTASSVDAAIGQAQAHCRQEADYVYEEMPNENLPALAVFSGFLNDLMS